VECRNVIARANMGQGPVLILAAHYDTRRWADRDPAQTRQPVPGANDGASGVAALLELGRVLDLELVPNEVWLVFFDAEDQGDIDGWEWIVGSSHMAETLTAEPEAVILLDMIGDADQQLYYEGNSDPFLRETLWGIAAGLGYEAAFIPATRWTMLDDHVPFIQRGIPAVAIIDFDYPAWHTLGDTLDKVSAESLERVGRTVETYLEER
jgi:Zn-dependent M28 family amino/carboxypeptidase